MILDPSAMTPFERYRFMISAIVPRPIAWVTTLSREGVPNAAPFSFFNGISSNPPLLGVCVGNRRDGTPKDTLQNAEETGEMVVNVVPYSLREAMVACSKEYPPDVDEIAEAGLATAPSDLVAPPRLTGSPVNMECRVVRIIPFGGTSMIVGEVVRIHAAEEVLEDGLVAFSTVRPVGRLGGAEYLDHEVGVFEIRRP
ncbi:MAG: flavin reductase family protein [Planctomycetota bacterium]|jgi:flavin reductase (DIM6/NTAB) family NADH-FMN oxidoreductase RutF